MKSPKSHVTLLDFETTGLDPLESEIMEIGLMRIEFDAANLDSPWRVLDQWSQLVKPKQPVPRPIRQLTGITEAMLENQPTLADVLGDFTAKLGTDPIVAHNASMEQKFLDHCVTPLNQVTYQVYNSVEPLALLFPDFMSVSLESFRRWAGIQREDSHRALADCEDLYLVLEKAWRTYHSDRQSLGPIVSKYLPDWWWAWFFNESKQPELQKSPSTPMSHPLPETLDSVFTEILPRKGLTFRPAQLEMAQDVAHAIANGERIAIEAPTGTGKSIAYLAPAAWMSQKQKTPVVIATHSKTLQDQLLQKDIPLLEVSAATVKGQENYLCLRKLHDLAAQLQDSPLWEDRWCVSLLLSYADLTDRVELDRMSRFVKSSFPGLIPILERVRSHHSTTLGTPCMFYDRCHFFNAARHAARADVMITNHALAFRWPQHLPKIEHVIFDEAHHLEDQITQAYTLELKEADLDFPLERLSKVQFRGNARRGPKDFERIEDLIADLPENALVWNSEALHQDLTQVRMSLDHLRTTLPSITPRKGDYLTNPLEGPVLEPLIALRGNLETLTRKLQTLEKELQKVSRKADFRIDTLKTYLRKFEQCLEVLQAFTDTTKAEVLRTLYWTTPDWSWRLMVEPIQVNALTDAFFKDLKSVVLTSATLSTGTKQDFVLNRIGLTLSKPMRVLPSPFQLDKQARVYFPNDVASPGTAEHFQSLVDFTAKAAHALGGKTLLLMTSNVRMRRAVEELRDRLEPQGIEVHDSISDPHAHEAFQLAFAHNRPALLIGSERFGEGLDIPGAALSCVILEKINEAMTRGPLAQARSAQTKFGLYDYEFPLRMIWLRQRIGRLIRSAKDTGVVVVFDSRPSRWSPGSKSHVFKAIQPMPIEDTTQHDILKNLEYFSTYN